MEKIKRTNISDRYSKVNVVDFAKLNYNSIDQFVDSLPNILVGKDFKEIVDLSVEIIKNKKSFIISMGAHVIKCGLGTIIIDFMRRGILTGLALNGACIIHDYEIAISGNTSEDVDKSIVDGSFGVTKETGECLNKIINNGAIYNLGIGEAVGKYLYNSNHPFIDCSVLAMAYKYKVPVTVHVAIGTDVIHIHPEANGECIGKSTMIDFNKFCNNISKLDDGIYMNIGSAVLLPEIFLKAITLNRNLGYKLENITTVNFDFIKQYRPLTNIVKRPIIKSKGYSIIGHHEIMIPLLFASIINKIN